MAKRDISVAAEMLRMRLDKLGVDYTGTGACPDGLVVYTTDYVETAKWAPKTCGGYKVLVAQVRTA